MKRKKLNNEELLMALNGSLEEQNIALRQLLYNKLIQKSILKFVEANNLPLDNVDDVFQDALIILIRHIKENTFNAKCKISTFLIGIAKYRCMEMKRRRGGIGDIPIENIAPQINAIDPEMICIQLESEKEDAEIKRQLFHQLGEACRKILLMRYWHKYTGVKIAEEMNWALQTTKNNLSRCKTKLKDLILKNPKIMNVIKSRL